MLQLFVFTLSGVSATRNVHDDPEMISKLDEDYERKKVKRDRSDGSEI